MTYTYTGTGFKESDSGKRYNMRQREIYQTFNILQKELDKMTFNEDIINFKKLQENKEYKFIEYFKANYVEYIGQLSCPIHD